MDTESASIETRLDPALAGVLPPDLSGALALWQSATGTQLRLDKQLSNGFTEAIVVVVFFERQNGATRKVVAKFSPEQPDTTPEPAAHRSAQEKSAAGFADNHLVRLLEATSLGSGWVLSLQDIAGGSLGKFRPLSAIGDSSDLPRSLAGIVDGVLEGWTPAHKTAAISPYEFYRHHVRKKLDPDGSLANWLTDLFGDAVLHSPSLVFANDEAQTAVTNPIWLALDRSGDASIETILGCSHGDLHLENVLVPIGPGGVDPASFRLIDLSYFRELAPLSLDPATLILSVIATKISTLGAVSRRALMGLLTASAPSVPLEIVGLEKVITTVQERGREYFQRHGLTDEWDQQQQLSLSACALVHASRPSMGEAERLWFFELAARCAHLFEDDQRLETFGTPLHIGQPLDAESRSARSMAEAIESVCADFDGATTTMCVVEPGALSGDGLRGIAGAGWDAVVEFDQNTDTGGGHFSYRQLNLIGRLVAPGQNATYVRGETTWLAADGLSPDGTTVAKNARQWRPVGLPFIRTAVTSLTQAYPASLTVVVFGDVSWRSRAIVEAALDLAGDRLRLVTVSQEESSILSEYDGERLVGTPNIIASHLSPRRAAAGGNQVVTVPGGPGGVVPLSGEALEWYESAGELLHSQVESRQESATSVAHDFYRGHRISWLELSVGVDVPRPGTTPHLLRILESELKNRGARRVSFSHVPGSGGTTVTRRAAWELRQRFPVFLVRNLSDHTPVASRIRRLAQDADRSVLVVIENTTDSVVDRLHDELRIDSVPCVLLIVSRRSGRERRFNVVPGRALEYLSSDEADEFRRLFAGIAPTKRAALDKLRIGRRELAVPFYLRSSRSRGSSLVYLTTLADLLNP